jgi:hypothetical protein
MVKFRASQKKVAAIYDEVPAQYYVAVLIFANFIANIVQASLIRFLPLHPLRARGYVPREAGGSLRQRLAS